MDGALLLLLTLLATSSEGGHIRGQQFMRPLLLEPSSRDLDVGIAIGVPEDGGLADDALNFPVGNGGMVYGPPAMQNAGPIHLVVNQQGIPVPLNSQHYQQQVQNLQPISTYGTQLQRDDRVQNLQPIPFYPLLRQQGVPARTVVQNLAPFQPYPMQFQQEVEDMAPIPMYPAAETTAQPRLVYNQQGVPVMISRPYGEKRVGAFKLRNDRGYQIMMEVPPAAPAATGGGGVLVMEMQATLYRPVQ